MLQPETGVSVAPAGLSFPDWLDRSTYPFRTRTILVEGQSMHNVDEGEGSPIVFVHGTPTWSYEYRHLIAKLSGKHRCIAPDHLGFGFSARPQDADYTPEAHARRFSEFMSKLAFPRVTLVIHDFGGPIAMDWALKNIDRVERLVILNSWMWSFEDDVQMFKRAKMIRGRLGRFLYRHLNASLTMITPSAYGDKKKLTKAIHKHYLNLFPDADSRELVLFALAKALSDSSTYFSSLWGQRSKLQKIPVAIIWGMKDSAFQPPILEKWLTACPHAQVTRLAGAGHWPHEEEPEQVIAAIVAARNQI